MHLAKALLAAARRPRHTRHLARFCRPLRLWPLAREPGSSGFRRARLSLLPFLAAAILVLTVAGCRWPRSDQPRGATIKTGVASSRTRWRMLVGVTEQGSDQTSVWAWDFLSDAAPMLLLRDRNIKGFWWSKPAQALVYEVYAGGDSDYLCVVRPFSGQKPTRSRITNARISQLTVSGRRPEIAYFLSRRLQGAWTRGDGVVYVRDLASGATRRIEWPGHFVEVAFYSPKEDCLAVRAKRGEYFQLGLMWTDGRPPRWLTDTDHDEMPMGWSPDGTKILAVTMLREVPTRRGLPMCDSIYDLRTGRYLSLTRSQVTDLGGSWSPDSRWVVLSSDRDGPFQLYRLNATSGKLSLLHPSREDARDASWSPEGDIIVFGRVSSGGKREVCLINGNGSGFRPAERQPEGSFWLSGTWVQLPSRTATMPMRAPRARTPTAASALTPATSRSARLK